DSEDLADQERRQAERGLVEHQEPRSGHHGAHDREHLLLAAAQAPRELAAPLAQPREQGERALQRRLRLVPPRARAPLQLLDPAPFAPISATTAASGTARLTPCTARIFP